MAKRAKPKKRPGHKKARKKAKLSPKAARYVSRKIGILIKEGRSRAQAVAIAYSMARKRGFKVPRGPLSKRQQKHRKLSVPMRDLIMPLEDRLRAGGWVVVNRAPRIEPGQELWDERAQRWRKARPDEWGKEIKLRR
jgi:hypothetical protein